MTRQTWQLVVGAWLCAGLGSGCALLGFGRPAPIKPADRTITQDGQVTQARRLTGEGEGEVVLLREGFGPLGSPYHPTDPRIFPALRDRNLRPVAIFPDPSGPNREHSQEGQEPHTGQTQPVTPPERFVPPTATQEVNPPQPEEPLVLALARLLKQDSAALKLLDSYDPATREWFQRMLPLIAELTRKGVEKLTPEDIDSMQYQLQELLRRLRERAELRIAKLFYCDPDPEQPGNIKPLPKGYAFLARCGNGPGEMVLLYTELGNLGMVHRGDFYEARLTSEVIISAESDPERPLFSKRVDDPRRPLRSRTLANDYFNTYSFYVPACIPPGRYILTLKIRDETTQPPRFKQGTIPFVVAAQAASVE
jgi:hypothetical protein